MKKYLLLFSLILAFTIQIQAQDREIITYDTIVEVSILKRTVIEKTIIDAEGNEQTQPTETREEVTSTQQIIFEDKNSQSTQSQIVEKETTTPPPPVTPPISDDTTNDTDIVQDRVDAPNTASAIGKEKYTISGTVKDADSGETLIGVTIIDKKTGDGTTSNAYGFYSITLPAGVVELTYSYLGFEDKIETMTLNQDITSNIDLGTGAEQLVEIVVKANSAKEQVQSTQMSVDRISMKEAKALPALFGEVDIIKTLQLKPGVSSGGEGTSGLIVRGGGPDQNLIVLDEAIVYNPSHLFGFFSTFNSDAVKDVQLFKGGFPAQYGGRLSSVIDVKLREGNRKRFAATGGLGLISSRLTLEGPIVKNKGSFIVSGRRTYADIFTRAINRANEDNPDANLIPDYFFYDLNAKVNYDLGEKDRIFLSGYFGRDAFLFDDDNFNFKFDWGNITTTARWNHIYNPRLFSNMTFTFSDYDYLIANQFDDFSFEVGSGIRDYNTKIDFYAEPGSRHSLKFGADWTWHEFNVGRLQVEREGEEDPLFDSETNFTGWEANAYVSDDFEVTKNFKINAGLRLSSFYSDSTFYYGLEPRFSMRYSVNPNFSIKASYTRMFQYIHLVSSSGASLPTDIWYPSNSVVKPQLSDQVAAGISVAIGDQFLLTNEFYYKWQQRQIDFRDGAEIFINPNLNDEFVFGRGYSYGNEIYLEKKEGKFTGWVGYTLSWTWRDFDDINKGNRFPATYDRRHDASVVLLYDLNRKFTFTGAWVYQTGRATSLPEARFYFQDIIGNGGGGIGTIFQERNSFRQAPYHRLDLGIVMKMFLNKPNFEADLTLNTYNTYDRRNPYFIYFETETDDIGGVTGIAGKQVSLFPILPSLTFNFKF